ncbi:TRAP transporter substrate-binding protein [Bradyrhizobium sp. Leo121]|uniref:TRAP transporter substrate-binding protein n=1 Tax=Bradyrhizobium sp. Leo121 TaxID=1571195 RepID=UPI0013EF00D7|nr:TRAP transporter substrate-binding protein [Bradyrhizobium sp. Leo121]
MANFVRLVVLVLVLVLAAASLLVAGGAPGHAATVLKYSNWLPVGNVMREKVVEPWIAEVAKVTNGSVKIEMLPKVIGSVPAQFDVARDAQADITIFVNGYTPGRFDVMEVAELPFMCDNAELYAAVVNNFYRTHLAQYGEYRGVHPLSVFVIGTGQLFNNKRPIRALADIKGLKLRSPQPGVTQSLNLLGAVPVSKPASELYELLSSGVIDGTLLVPESVGSFKLIDSLPYATIVPGALYNTILTLGINEDKWAALSRENQDAITRISDDLFARAVGRAYLDGDRVTWEAMRKGGKSIETASPELVAEVRQALKPVETAWIEKARKRGVADPQKLIDDLRADIAAASK